MKLIGVDLGGTNVRAGLVQSGRILNLESHKHADFGKNQIIEEICRVIEKVLQPGIRGIGLGVPSAVDAKGTVYAVANIPSWRKVPLKEILEKRFRLPVFINNDAKCFALGELHYGAGRGYKNLVGLIIGTGMGAGVIVEGKLFSGTNGAAGELGHMPYLEHEFEYYCSGRFFQREFGVDAFAAEQCADAGDAKAKKMFEAFGEHLGNAIQAVLYAYDPEVIVLGGGVSKAFRHFEKAIHKNLKIFRFQAGLKKLVIAPSKHPHIAVLAAAALCLDQQM
ncbi:MAG TPA: ROK family protein [Verrucomicrobiae bacterium]|nr:ROK family protein [Verrucomicrobiae bacterium]